MKNLNKYLEILYTKAKSKYFFILSEYNQSYYKIMTNHLLIYHKCRRITLSKYRPAPHTWLAHDNPHDDKLSWAAVTTEIIVRTCQPVIG